MDAPLAAGPLVDFVEIGNRLRAYRLGAGMRAEAIAEQLGVSRAAIYRMEKGDIVKIETLGRLAQLLGTSLASMLGVESEYYHSAVAYIERMRQLEHGATRILAHFEPISYLLTSPDYAGHLRQMLAESPQPAPAATIDALLDLLEERKQSFARSVPPITSLIDLRSLERFVHFGLVGRLDLPPAVRMERSLAARREIERVIDLLDAQPIGLQIGIVDGSMPNVTFQVFERPGKAYVATSPFRFGEFPNVSTGIATVTAAPEAVRLYTTMVNDLWQRAYKGRDGAALLRRMLNSV